MLSGKPLCVNTCGGGGSVSRRAEPGSSVYLAIGLVASRTMPKSFKSKVSVDLDRVTLCTRINSRPGNTHCRSTNTYLKCTARPNTISLTSISPKIGLVILGVGIFARKGIWKRFQY